LAIAAEIEGSKTNNARKTTRVGKCSEVVTRRMSSAARPNIESCTKATIGDRFLIGRMVAARSVQVAATTKSLSASNKPAMPQRTSGYRAAIRTLILRIPIHPLTSGAGRYPSGPKTAGLK